MLESIPFILMIGTLLGFLSGLGIGGGSLLILWLTLVLDLPPSAARGINLLFFLPSALIAAWLRWKQGVVPLQKIWPAMLSGSAGALVFSLLSTNLDTVLLKKLFGILLIATGIREICYFPKKNREGL